MKQQNLMRSFKIAMDRLWIIGRETYIRFYPNPGIRIKVRTKFIAWSKREGWKYGSVR